MIFASRVGAFNDFLRNHAEDETAQHALAARMFGRWRSGAPLPLAPGKDDLDLGADRQRNNDFDFKGDVRGFICPHSSHMRRMNPRGSDLSILTDENIHRIIRRSSTFGPKWTADVTATDDKPDERAFTTGLTAANASKVENTDRGSCSNSMF